MISEPRGLSLVASGVSPQVFIVATPALIEVGRSLSLPDAVALAREFGAGSTVRLRGQVVVLIVPAEDDVRRKVTGGQTT